MADEEDYSDRMYRQLREEGDDFGTRLDRCFDGGFSDEEILMQLGPENHELLVALLRVRKEKSGGLANLAWAPDDVQTLNPSKDGKPMTDEQAREFLESNQKHIRDRLCELGWEVISTLLYIDGWRSDGSGDGQTDDEFVPGRTVGECSAHGEFKMDAPDSPCPSCEEGDDTYEYRRSNVECSIDGDDYVEFDAKLSEEILRRTATPEEIDHFKIVDGIESEDVPEGQQAYSISAYYTDNDQPYSPGTIVARTPEAAAALCAWRCAEDNQGHATLTVVEVRDANDGVCDLGDRNLNFEFNTDEDTCPINEDGELIE